MVLLCNELPFSKPNYVHSTYLAHVKLSETHDDMRLPLISLKIGVQNRKRTGRRFLTLWSSSVNEAGVSQLFLCAAALALFPDAGRRYRLGPRGYQVQIRKNDSAIIGAIHRG